MLLVQNLMVSCRGDNNRAGRWECIKIQYSNESIASVHEEHSIANITSSIC